MIQEAIYSILKEFTNLDSIYLDFVSDKNIDNNKTYIVYSLISSSPYYNFLYARNVYQIYVYSNSLNKVIKLQDVIGRGFTQLKRVICDVEICGCNISNEVQNYVDDFYQAISTVNILYKY